MSNYDTLIAVLGWEDRFYEGIKADIEKYQITSLLLIRYTECNEMTYVASQKIEALCIEASIKCEYLDISENDTVAKWKTLQDYFGNIKLSVSKILLDISTMPRDTIWSVLSFLKGENIEIDYIYYTPNGYNQEWLSKEHGEPRLLFKHSGISSLEKPTALIILTGFEIERTKQLVYFYEPKKTILGLQIGDQFDNEKRNIEIHESIKGYTETSDFQLNAYDLDSGFESINSQVLALKNDYNIIITSLGPKPTAISIYKVFIEHPEIALAYVPSKEFNIGYSTGINLDKVVFGNFSQSITNIE